MNNILYFISITCVNYFSRLVCKDISGGQENIRIPATNVCDVPPVAPSGEFSYLIFSLVAI